MAGVNVRAWGLDPTGLAWFRPVTRYIVFRPAPGLPHGFMPPHLDGLWIDRPAAGFPGPPGDARAVPTGRYERRDDGLVAEIYEVCPTEEASGWQPARPGDTPGQLTPGEGDVSESPMAERMLVQRNNPWACCACGHIWLRHDVEEYAGDGSETCCDEGCDQKGCPGRRPTEEAGG